MGIKLTGNSACCNTLALTAQRTVPQPVAPGRRGGTEESVARSNSGGVQSGNHEINHRKVRMLDRGWDSRLVPEVYW